MVTKKTTGTSITALCANIETNELVRVPLFVRERVKSEKRINKMAKENAIALGLEFVKAEVEYVTLKYTMEDEEFYAHAKEEIE